MTEALKK
jgi:chromosome segregation ATPase